jgi:hypothetical protein
MSQPQSYSQQANRWWLTADNSITPSQHHPLFWRYWHDSWAHTEFRLGLICERSMDRFAMDDFCPVRKSIIRSIGSSQFKLWKYSLWSWTSLLNWFYMIIIQLITWFITISSACDVLGSNFYKLIWNIRPLKSSINCKGNCMKFILRFERIIFVLLL